MFPGKEIQFNLQDIQIIGNAKNVFTCWPSDGRTCVIVLVLMVAMNEGLKNWY